MEKRLNKKLIFSLVTELEESASRTKNSIRRTIDSLANMHPEIMFSREELDQLSPEIQDGIIKRIRRTLKSMA